MFRTIEGTAETKRLIRKIVRKASMGENPKQPKSHLYSLVQGNGQSADLFISGTNKNMTYISLTGVRNGLKDTVSGEIDNHTGRAQFNETSRLVDMNQIAQRLKETLKMLQPKKRMNPATVDKISNERISPDTQMFLETYADGHSIKVMDSLV